MSWVNDLDILASAGVLEYDAPARILGVQPRYIGNPSLETIPELLPGVTPKTQAPKDEFKQEETTPSTKSWKKWLLGTLIATGLFFGIKNIESIKEAVKKIDLKGVKDFAQKIWDGTKDISQKAWDGIKNLWGKFTDLFKKH